MTVQIRTWRGGMLVMLALTAAACGDPNMQESRGYTKAPLERPGLIVRGEEPGEMARYGGPRRLNTDRIELPEAPPAAAAAAPQAAVELPPGVTQEMVAEGQQLYGSSGNCFTCHGQGGTGTPLAPALNEASWIHIDGSFEAIAQIIAEGVPTPEQFPAPMPARGGAPLTDEQVRLITAYVYSISR
jgi:mono/diheme cytochrome c family protein